MEVSLQDIKEAADRLKGITHRTELIFSTTFSQFSGNQIYLKPENLQKTGSFKIRGAYNKIVGLSEEEKDKGVIAASAGNHAQGVALAASENGIESTIVMPRGAPMAKIAATRNYGAEVILSGDVFDETCARAREIQKETDAVFIHPFDDPDIISGQGTIALEIIDEMPDVDVILVPVGGGGLISGIAVAVRALNPAIKIIGVESVSASSMQQSLTAGRISTLKELNTIADGIAVKKPGALTFDFCRKYIDDIVCVDEEEIANAILMLLERAKLVVEGAGAAALAALLNGKIGIRDKKIVAILSGGNIDFNMISRIIERGLAKAGRRTRIRTYLKDRPGNLQQLLSEIAGLDANVISISHHHYQPGISIDKAEVELELETRHQKHVKEIYQVLNNKGYETDILL